MAPKPTAHRVYIFTSPSMVAGERGDQVATWETILSFVRPFCPLGDHCVTIFTPVVFKGP
jgi:hypothetical protein